MQTGDILAMKHVLQNKKYKNRELDIMKQIKSNYTVRLVDYFYKEEAKVSIELSRENTSTLSWNTFQNLCPGCSGPTTRKKCTCRRPPSSSTPDVSSLASKICT